MDMNKKSRQFFCRTSSGRSWNPKRSFLLFFALLIAWAWVPMQVGRVLSATPSTALQGGMEPPFGVLRGGIVSARVDPLEKVP